MKVTPNLIAYSGLTLFLLYAIAQRVVPYERPGLTGCQVGYVYDGDTVELLCGAKKTTARLVGFDTPETKDPGCRAELKRGKQATERLRALVTSGEITMHKHGHDKYGRDLLELRVDGRDVGDILVEEGLAVTYRSGSRINWCERLNG